VFLVGSEFHGCQCTLILCLRLQVTWSRAGPPVDQFSWSAWCASLLSPRSVIVNRHLRCVEQRGTSCSERSGSNFVAWPDY
jgi:hypothetical protein